MAQLSGIISSTWWLTSSNPIDQETPQSTLNRKFQQDFANGTNDYQINQKFSDTRTIAASGNDDLDLTSSSNPLEDAHGRPLQLTKVKAFRVYASPANTNDVVVGGAAANAWQGPFNATTHKVNVPPGGFVEFVHPKGGWTVTAGSADILRIANSGAGTSVDYDIAIAGVE